VEVNAHVITVIGTRPEAIKMLPVVMELERSAHLEPVVVSTGQHSEMVREILCFGGVTAEVDLQAGASGSLNGLVAGVMQRFESFCEERFGRDGRVNAEDRDDVLERGYPAGVLVHGDTSSAMAAALGAFNMRIPVGHVEAGLRTHNPLSPYPEELNRQVISRVAAFHLAPTNLNKMNLVREGIDAEQVFVTGNTGIDTLVMATRRSAEFDDPRIAAAVEDPRPLVLATAHRRENWGGGLRHIGEGLARLVRQHPEVQVVLVTHPNPEARREVAEPVQDLPQVIVTGPLDYVPFAHVQAAARFAISDSGGIQEEAPALGTPVLVTRDSTERSEGIDAGTLRLVGTDPTAIADAADQLLVDDELLARMAFAENPYGDGRSAARVVAALEHLMGFAPDPQRYGSGFNRRKVLRAGGYPGTSEVEPDRPVVPSMQQRLVRPG
jgi:UDP-N-acetylglucosamine 2-epimerase (non-hydrolysing)